MPVQGVGVVNQGDDLVTILLEVLDQSQTALLDGDLIVITSKVVSKAEGRVVPFDGTEEHKVALVESESKRILRRRGPLRITESHHGFVSANAGIDLSNTAEGTAVLLPKDPDRTARRFRAELRRRRGVGVAVVITDTFGRTWRNGVTDVALGSAGILPILDLRGTSDANGRMLEATEVAGVDEIAGAANLVLGKALGTPFALVRGLDTSYFGEGYRFRNDRSFSERRPLLFVSSSLPSRTSPDSTERGATLTPPPTTHVASKFDPRPTTAPGPMMDDRTIRILFDDGAGQQNNVLKHCVVPDHTVAVHDGVSHLDARVNLSRGISP